MNKIYSNVPEGPDPYEHFRYIEEIISKEQFPFLQVLKLYYLIKYQQDDINLEYVLSKLENILQRQPIQLHPVFIEQSDFMRKLRDYFAYGFGHMVSNE